MQQLVSRYRDRLINSSSQIKALSASRQKSLTTQSNNLLNENNNNAQSSQSLKKSRNKYTASNTKLGENQRQQEEEKEKELRRSHEKINVGGVSNNKVQGNSGNFSQLPPQPIGQSSTKQLKQKQKNNTHNHNHNQQINPLKSSRKITQKQKQKHSTQNLHSQKPQKQKQKSKSKKPSSRTPKKQTIVTQFSVTQSFSESIYQVFIKDLKQKSAFVNLISLINKDDLKQRIRLLLDEYFSKRTQVWEKEKYGFSGGSNLMESNVKSHYIDSTNRNMTQSYAMLNQQTYSNVNLQQQGSTTQILPSNLSKPSQTQKSLSSQLQKRYIQSQKQCQYLSNKLQTYTKRIQTLTKQVQRLTKIQKLITNTIDSQNQTRKQVIRLRKQLQYNQLKNTQQQKIWKREVVEMKQIINELRVQLQNKYENYLDRKKDQ